VRVVPSRSASHGIAVAALAAVRGGRGEHVDVSMLECMAVTLGGFGGLHVSLTGAPSVTTATVSSSPVPSSSAVPPPSLAPDITDVKYTVPSGWERNSNYVEVIPLEPTYQAKYLIPAGATPGLDVISIVLYRLPAAHLVDTRARQVARILAYNAKRSVAIKRKLEDTVIGGLPAFDESVVQPGGSQGEFRYAAWFIFGGAHVVQISCQVASQVAAVAAGCQKLLDSVTFS